jgi:hypothetical protein
MTYNPHPRHIFGVLTGIDGRLLIYFYISIYYDLLQLEYASVRMMQMLKLNDFLLDSKRKHITSCCNIDHKAEKKEGLILRQ